ncbi:MAG: methyltransferase domain-containing protein [Candidatus Limnocylindria bacterium]
MTTLWDTVRELRGRRTDERELLDAETLDPRELRANLRELARLNRLPGGVWASIHGIESLTGDGGQVSVLDVGTGGGDMPIAFVRHARARGRRWIVVAAEPRPEILELARRRVRSEPAITVEPADARQLPFADRSFDVAHASLLLHHLDRGRAIEALSEMARVAREGVVINDLQRGPLHYAVTAAVVLGLTQSRYSRHDGLVSARRAYTLDERHDLIEAAGLRVAWQSSRLAPRVATAAVPRRHRAERAT